MGQSRFTVQGTCTLLNGREFLVKGLRCSNALISDAATEELVGNLDLFAGYGVNTVVKEHLGQGSSVPKYNHISLGIT